MAALKRHELAPGLCAFLSMPSLALRADSKCGPKICSAQTSRSLSPIPFLILELDLSRRACLAIYLTSTPRIHDEKLGPEYKTGGGIGWHDRPSYFTPSDGWLIPFDSFTAASSFEMSSPATRMRYARGGKNEIERVRSLTHTNPTSMIPVWSAPVDMGARIGNYERSRSAVAFSPNFGR